MKRLLTKMKEKEFLLMPLSNIPLRGLFVSPLLIVLVCFTTFAPASALGDQDASCKNVGPPQGALRLGYTRQVFCLAPTIADISFDGVLSSGYSKLYAGQWYAKSPIPRSEFDMVDGTLVMYLGAEVATESRKSLPGALPLLYGADGFYVEFSVRLSDNDSDHWPTLYLMPQEHNTRLADYQPGDARGFQRYMELDVDEGGFNNGHHGALINWSGIWPHYDRKISANNSLMDGTFDRTNEHIFGLSYDPMGKQVHWWIDGKEQGSASTEEFPSIVNSYHYYLIMSNESHAANKPYKMYLKYLAAWSGPVAPLR